MAGRDKFKVIQSGCQMACDWSVNIGVLALETEAAIVLSNLSRGISGSTGSE